MKAPDKCPICQSEDKWILIDTTKKGFNAKNSLIGGIFLGPVGLVAGASGKKKSLYKCADCGFSHEYDEEADKNNKAKQKFNLNEFSKTNNISIWINIVKKLSPICQFCGLPQDLSIKYANGGYMFKCDHCQSVFQCEFTFGGKVKENSTFILNCGNDNINNLEIGKCEVNILIKDPNGIKYKK